jgi:phosphocarrier protein HPr
MKFVEITIQHPVGLHARPAALFVQLAQKYTSEISISYQDQTVNAKSILALLGLGVLHGASILIKAEGPDEQEAVDALIALISANFGERI